MDESARLAEEATTRSGEDALLAVDDDVASTGSFQILIAFHVPAANGRESENNIWLLFQQLRCHLTYFQVI